MTVYEKILETVAETYKPGDQVQNAINQGKMGLHFGPYGASMGFITSLDICREYANESLPDKLYYDEQTETVHEYEPEPEWDDELKEWYRPFLQECIVVGPYSIRLSVFGDLALYL